MAQAPTPIIPRINAQQDAEVLDEEARHLAALRMEAAHDRADRASTYRMLTRIGLTVMAAGLINALLSQSPQRNDHSLALFVIGLVFIFVGYTTPVDMFGVGGIDDTMGFFHQLRREENHRALLRELYGTDGIGNDQPAAV